MGAVQSACSIQHMFLGLGPYDTDPAHNIIAAGQELDDRDLSDLSDLSDACSN